MLTSLRAQLLIATFLFASPAAAQFKPIEIPAAPMVPTMPAPMPTYPALTAPNLTTPNLSAPNLSAPAPVPSLQQAAPAVAAPAEPPAAALMVPGCPGRTGCPEPEGEGALSEAAKELLKEFVKCEAEGKSFDQCLLDDPPPPTLTGLSDDERVQLTSCLGSTDLNATEALWNGCVARVR